MTLETAKRLYKHYVDNGMVEEAENIKAKRPTVANQSTPKETTSSKK